MKDISTELERVVQDNIENVEMGVFKREMQRLQTMEVEFVQLREMYNKLSKDHDDLSNEYDKRKHEIENILNREKELEKREKEMAEQKTQLHIDNQLISLRKESADQRVVDHQKMVELIFRGPIFQKSVVETRSHDEVVTLPISDNGMIGSSHREYGLNDTTSTTTTEETK